MKDIIILDDFYKNPDLVRNFALNLEYENTSTPNYPGFQSVVPCLSSLVVDKFEKTVGSKIDLAASKSQMGYFRYILESGKSRLKVHTDMTDWTVIVYLNSKYPSSLDVGTNLYQHRKTGLYGPPQSRDMLELGYKNLKDFETKVVVPDTLNRHAWKVIRSIPFKYNRCVLFKANKMFHSHAKGFGNSAKDGRLTQNFFFNLKDSYV